MGAWIETVTKPSLSTLGIVAPRVGAWIETNVTVEGNISYRSHPVWVRGLKLYLHYRLKNAILVAPRVGAWIETPSCDTFILACGRTPCGCVD